jgi:hypothetical protein
VPVKNLVDYLAEGDPLEEFLDNFPGVSQEPAEDYLRMSLRVTEESVGAGTAGWEVAPQAQAIPPGRGQCR